MRRAAPKSRGSSEGLDVGLSWVVVLLVCRAGSYSDMIISRGSLRSSQREFCRWIETEGMGLWAGDCQRDELTQQSCGSDPEAVLLRHQPVATQHDCSLCICSPTASDPTRHNVIRKKKPDHRHNTMTRALIAPWGLQRKQCWLAALTRCEMQLFIANMSGRVQQKHTSDRKRPQHSKPRID